MRLRFLHRSLRARLRDQRAELRALAAALRPDEIAVDVGANKGSYLLWLSRAVPRGRVVAFEPQPALAAYLRDVRGRLGLHNITVEAAGVSDRAGTLTLWIPGTADSGNASFEVAVRERESCRPVEVPVRTLDEYFAHETGRIGAIKIDVEGHELHVLRGAEQVLQRHAPVLVMECENRHLADGDVFTVLHFLRARGYDGHFVFRSRLIPLAEFRPERHQRFPTPRAERKSYVNNFVLTRSVLPATQGA